MKIVGVNETTHDAAIAVIENGEILFAGHAERYSKEKNDWFLTQKKRHGAKKPLYITAPL